MKHYSHGEVNIFQSNKAIPEDAKPLKGNGGKFIIADSETTGNFHCVQDKEGVEIYQKDGVLYLKNDVEVDVFCIHESRHDTITLEPSVWEIEPAKEYDHLSQEVKNVAD